MAEDEKPIRVVDRRMFTADGELRPDFEPEDTPSSAEPSSSAKASEDRSEGKSEPAEASAPGGPGPKTPAEAGRRPEADSAPPPDDRTAEPRGAFALIVQILAMPAYAALGLVPDPASGRRRIDRVAAQEMIDLLAALERKTQGNLSFEESNFLSRVLTELRLAFVEVTRPPTK
jgi:hypothetical protein